MTWTMIHCDIPSTAEEVEQMEIMRDMLKRLEENPEMYLQLYHPKFAHFPFWRDVLFDKICKLVKKEVTKEIVSLEAQLQHHKEGKTTWQTPRKQAHTKANPTS